MNIGLRGILGLLLFSITVGAEPFKPASDSFVAEKLPKSLIALRKTPPLKAGSSEDRAIILAREYLQIAQRTSDPAFVRYADELLAGLNRTVNPAALFLKAVIKQHKHEFDASLQQLEEVCRLAPGNEEAALLMASILTTQAKYEQARAIFARNLRLTSSLRGLTIFLTITSLNGNLEKSELTLAQAVNARGNGTEQAFAWCALAEMAVRQGHLEKAAACFSKSLELEPGDSYTLASYCDLLMTMGRKSEVLLKAESNSMAEALLTRRFLAMKVSRDQVDLFADQLKKSGHWRELAMLQLEVTHDPEAALENAVQNWEKQKEPIDTLLLLRAALACHNPARAEPVRKWLGSSKMEDQRIEQLMASLNKQLAAR
jgi:predicted Zn-dependent protease